MPVGRKPPIMPPRNLLGTSTATIGKRPPLPYRQRLDELRDKRRTQRWGRSTFAVTSASEVRATTTLPNDPRTAARQALTATQPTTERGRSKAQRKVECAQRRIADELAQARTEGAAEAVAQPAADVATNRPPRREAGRYDGLKDGQLG